MPIKITRATFHESRESLYQLAKGHNFTINEYEKIEAVIQHLLKNRPVVVVNNNPMGVALSFGGARWLHFDNKKFWAIRSLSRETWNRRVDTEVITYKEIFERF